MNLEIIHHMKILTIVNQWALSAKKILYCLLFGGFVFHQEANSQPLYYCQPNYNTNKGCVKIDTTSLEFTYFPLVDLRQNALLKKLAPNKYIIHNTYDINNIPLKVEHMHYTDTEVKRKYFHFNYGSDLFHINIINKLSEKFDSNDSDVIIKKLAFCSKKELNNEFIFQAKQRPAILMLLGDSTLIPIYNDTLSYSGKINSFHLLYRPYKVRSQVCDLDNKCDSISILFDLNNDYTFYEFINDDTLIINSSNITIKNTNSKDGCRYDRISNNRAKKLHMDN